MAVIPTNALIQWCDSLTSSYRIARGSDPAVGTSPSNPNGFGLGISGGDWGTTNIAYGPYNALATAAGDGPNGISAVASMISAAQKFVSNQGVLVYAQNAIAPMLAALTNQIASALVSTGVSTIDAYLTTLNSSGPSYWQAMMPPAFQLMWTDAMTAGTTLSQQNLWQEVLQSTLYPYALGEFVVSGAVFTGGYDISASGLYAGGFPYINVTAVTGTGTITVTGTAFNPSNVGTGNSPVVTGKTWTYVLGSATPGVYQLVPGGATPAPSNSLIMKSTNISVSGGISAGTMFCEAHRPSGRNAFSY